MSERTYDDNVKIWKKAYEEVAEVCGKYSKEFERYASDFCDIKEMESKAKNHLVLIEWYEKYGLKLPHDKHPHGMRYLDFGRYGAMQYIKFIRFDDAARDKEEGRGYSISWPDDDRQPMNEWCMKIGFSTGAYIFGEDYNYQQQLFQDFFKELQSYKPDYSDSCNHSLYWKLENAKPIFDNFSNILEKYRKSNTSELKQREADKLRKQLEKIEAELAPTQS